MTSYMEDLINNRGYSYDEALAMDEMFRNPRISQDPTMIRGNNGLMFDPGWQLRGINPITSDADLRPKPAFIPNPESEKIAMGAVSPSLRTEAPVTIARRYRPSTYSRVEPVTPDYSHPMTEQRSLERSLEEEKLLHTPFQLQPKKLSNLQELTKGLMPNAAAALPTTGYDTLSDDRKALLDAAIAASKTSSAQQTSLPQAPTEPIAQQQQANISQAYKPNPLEAYWLDPNNALNTAYPAAENTDEAITLRNLKKTLSPEEWQQFEEIRQGIAATGAALATLGPFGFSGTTAATTSSSSRFLPWVARNVANWWKNAPEPAKQWFRQALRAEAKTFDKAILANDVSGLQTILSNPSLIRAMAQPSSQIGKSLMKPIGTSSSYFSPTVQQLAKWSKWLGWE